MHLQPGQSRRLDVAGRIAAMLVVIFIVQSLVCALALLPVTLAWSWILAQLAPDPALRAVAAAFLIVPSYAAFAIALMVWSALAMRVTGTRTAPDAAWRIADLEWDLLRWVHSMVATHLVRVCAGSLFRGSPVWTAYLRLNGARIGRRVFVNSLHVVDHNLLEFGDDVVIGDGVHLSGHTVERGVVKTGRVRLGPGVTIGLGAIVDIGVEAGPRCQIAPLSVVLKHTRLEGDAVYAGSPARRIS
jgi:acetyltransferase-like isoleucine patch superfamily enzyme